MQQADTGRVQIKPTIEADLPVMPVSCILFCIAKPSYELDFFLKNKMEDALQKCTQCAPSLLDVQPKGPDYSYPKVNHKKKKHCVDISSSEPIAFLYRSRCCTKLTANMSID